MTSTLPRDELLSKFMGIIRARWNFEPSEFDAIEKVFTDEPCIGVLLDTKATPAQLIDTYASLQEAIAFLQEAATIKANGFIAPEVTAHNARVLMKAQLLYAALSTSDSQEVHGGSK